MLRAGHDCVEKKCHGTESRRLHGCHSRSSGEEESKSQLLRLVRWNDCIQSSHSVADGGLCVISTYNGSDNVH